MATNSFFTRPCKTVKQALLPVGEYTVKRIAGASVALSDDVQKGGKQCRFTLSAELAGSRATVVNDCIGWFKTLFLRPEHIFGTATSGDATLLFAIVYYAGLGELVEDEATGAEQYTFTQDVWDSLIEGIPDADMNVETLELFLTNLSTLLKASREQFNVQVTHRAAKGVTYANITGVLPFEELDD